jgi:hypothetical protein
MSHYREHLSILGCESASHEGDKISQTVSMTTQFRTPEDVNHQQTCHETLKSCVPLLVKWHSKCVCNVVVCFPMPPHVRHGLCGLPPSCGRSVTDF